jgi:hypothetical protein
MTNTEQVFNEFMDGTCNAWQATQVLANWLDLNHDQASPMTFEYWSAKALIMKLAEW